jgi:hypothetical protein
MAATREQPNAQRRLPRAPRHRREGSSHPSRGCVYGESLPGEGRHRYALARILKRTLGDGCYTTCAYDAAGRPTQLLNCFADGSPLVYFEYGYDAANRRAPTSSADLTLTRRRSGRAGGVTPTAAEARIRQSLEVFAGAGYTPLGFKAACRKRPGDAGRMSAWAQERRPGVPFSASALPETKPPLDNCADDGYNAAREGDRCEVPGDRSCRLRPDPMSWRPATRTAGKLCGLACPP